MIEDGRFGICCRVSQYALETTPECWKQARREMMYEFFNKLIEPIADDGAHHVFKVDTLREDDPSTMSVNYYLSIRHSIAQVQNIIMANFSSIPPTAVRACHWCGNVLALDKRGGCKACGGPAGNNWGES
jgi:hypothetical protein